MCIECLQLMNLYAQLKLDAKVFKHLQICDNEEFNIYLFFKLLTNKYKNKIYFTMNNNSGKLLDYTFHWDFTGKCANIK